MANFILVHGAWQGAWVWDAVTAGLHLRGHQVRTLDLPGSGADRTVAADVTLESYARAIGDAVTAAGAPVTLVGHSMGGIAVSAAAELVAHSLERLVYLSAFLPCDGDSLVSLNTLNLPGHQPPPTELQEDGAAVSVRADAI